LIYIAKLRISPDAAFSPEWTSTAFFIVVIGGIGTLEGPVVGTLLYFVLRELLADYGGAYMIALGLLAIATMLWRPRGLWGATGWQVLPVKRLSGRATEGTTR
jgi:branched-chain amino acid transport system permease protein